MKHFRSIILLTAVIWALPACAHDDSPAPAATASTGPAAAIAPKIDFVTQVKPILQERCVTCHNKKTMPTRHSFETRALTMEGDQKGPILVPGNPNASRLLIAVKAPKVHEQAMPPVSVRVSEAEIEVLTRWIQEGANWPAGKSGRIVPDEVPLE